MKNDIRIEYKLIKILTFSYLLIIFIVAWER